MVHHIVMWNFLESMTQEEKQAAGAKMKELLEPIGNLVDGAISIKVIVNELDSSNRDVALISQFETVEALQSYQVHPAHVEAGKFVRSVTCNRSCLDFGDN